MSGIWINVVIDINGTHESRQIIDYRLYSTSAPVVQWAAAGLVRITPV